MTLAIKSRNSMDRGVLGLDLSRARVRVGLHVQIQIMFEKRPAFLAFVNRYSDSDHENCANNDKKPFHIFHTGAAAPVFKLGARPC